MGFFSDLLDKFDEDGASRSWELEQKDVPVDAPLEGKAAVPGEKLPVNTRSGGGGARYSAAVTPGGRVHTEQVIQKTPLLRDDISDVLTQKEYAKSREDPTFVEAPTMERAFGVDKSEPGWGMKGYGGKILSGLVKGVAPVIGGGLMGGRKGAMEAWQGAVNQRRAEQEQYQNRLQELQSDRVMKEAYEMARMNYEADYNAGKTDLPFGDYLAQAMEAVSFKGSGLLGQLIEMYGREEGMRKYAEMQAANRARGGGGAGYEWRKGIDPLTGEEVHRKVPVSSGELEGKTTVKTGPTGQVVTRTGKPPLGDFVN